MNKMNVKLVGDQGIPNIDNYLRYSFSSKLFINNEDKLLTDSWKSDFGILEDDKRGRSNYISNKNNNEKENFICIDKGVDNKLELGVDNLKSAFSKLNGLINSDIRDNTAKIIKHDNKKYNMLKSRVMKKSFVGKSIYHSHVLSKVNEINVNLVNTKESNKKILDLDSNTNTNTNSDIDLDLDDIINNMLTLRKVNKTNTKNKYNPFTDTKMKTQSKIINFNDISPIELNSIKSIITEKKDRSYYKFIKELKELETKEHELDFSISDFSLGGDLENPEQENNNNNLVKNLNFDDTPIITKTELNNNTTDTINISSSKRVSFSSEPIILNDNSNHKERLYRLPTHKRIYPKNKKTKSILKNKTSNNTSTNNESSSRRSSIDCDKSIALDKLNQLIKECEIEDKQPDSSKYKSRNRNLNLNTNTQKK